MTFSIPPAMQSQVVDHCLHFRARCFKIQLTVVTNVVFYFTDHSEDLLLPDDQIYKAMSSMDSSAQRREENLETTNKDARGIISSDEITFDMLHNGLFQGARVDEYLVDHRVPFIVPIDHTTYFIKQVSFDGARWQAEIEGLTGLLRRPSGDVWGPMCRVPLFSQGNGKCNLSPGLYQDTGPITIVNPRLQFRFLVTNTRWTENGYGNDGVVEFITPGSPLFGFKSIIKSYSFSATDPDGDIILQLATPIDMSIFEQVVVQPGCDHIHDGDCINKFDNLVNFQGEPFIPGGDKARRGVSVI